MQFFRATPRPRFLVLARISTTCDNPTPDSSSTRGSPVFLLRRSSLLILAALGPFTLDGQQIDPRMYSEMRWRMIGPHRASRTKAAAGIPDQPNVFYIGAVNGGGCKNTDF